jgi:hypothetical protein
LAATFVPRQPVAAPSGCAIATAYLDRTPVGGFGEIAHQVLNLIVVPPVQRCWA